MDPIIIHEWAVVPGGGRYDAPEVAGIRITGVVVDHPKRPGGPKQITTSRVLSADGRFVTTQPGTRYQLGRIEPGYRKWLREQQIPYDPANPIRVRT